MDLQSENQRWIIWKLQGLENSYWNQTKRKVKRFQINNGLEFCSYFLNDFYKENGIARYKTVVGNPQQNGLTERFNRTILVKVRCMLFSAGLSKIFLGKSSYDCCIPYKHISLYSSWHENSWRSLVSSVTPWFS